MPKYIIKTYVHHFFVRDYDKYYREFTAADDDQAILHFDQFFKLELKNHNQFPYEKYLLYKQAKDQALKEHIVYEGKNRVIVEVLANYNHLYKVNGIEVYHNDAYKNDDYNIKKAVQLLYSIPESLFQTINLICINESNMFIAVWG